MSSAACVLVSGGVESSVLLADSLSRYDRVTPLYVRGRLRWENAELHCLKKFLRRIRCGRLAPLKILEMRMDDVYGPHWSVTGRRVPGIRSRDEAVYLPGRNVILCSKAACYAVLNGIFVIEIGVLKSNPFSDGSEAFFRALSRVLTIGLGREIRIKAPFRKLEKEDVVLKGKSLPLGLTFSCLDPKGRRHCGRCNKCAEREAAFEVLKKIS